MCMWAPKTTLQCSLKDCFRKDNLVFIQRIGRHKIKEHEAKKEKSTHAQAKYQSITKCHYSSECTERITVQPQPVTAQERKAIDGCRHLQFQWGSYQSRFTCLVTVRITKEENQDYARR